MMYKAWFVIGRLPYEGEYLEDCIIGPAYTVQQKTPSHDITGYTVVSSNESDIMAVKLFHTSSIIVELPSELIELILECSYLFDKVIDKNPIAPEQILDFVSKKNMLLTHLGNILRTNGLAK